MFWVQVILTAFTAGAFGAATYYACYAKKQWITLQQTYSEIRSQTGQIAQQTTTLRQQLVGTEAAIVNVGPGLSNPGEILISAENVGKVAARDVTITVTLSRAAFPSGVEIGKPIITSFTTPVLGTSPNNLKQSIMRFADSWIPRDALEVGQEPKTTIKILIVGSYDDGFKDIIKTNSCQMFMPPYKIKTRIGYNQAPGGFSQCAGFQHDLHWIMQMKQDESNGIYH